MKFGVFEHMDHTGLPLERQFKERLKLIKALDRHGFHAYHLAEHHCTPLGLAPSPGVFLAAVSQHTEKLRFGPLVYTLPLYHPLRLIEEICMLDHLSGGRLEFGVGRGVSPYEVGYFGVDPKDGPKQFPEALRCILQGLTNDRLTFHGEFYDFDDVPMVLKPLQKPYPPIWYGIVSPETAYWACKESANFVMLGPTETMKQAVAKYKEHWSGEFSRDPGKLPLMGIQRHVVVSEDEGEAIKIAKRSYRPWVGHMRLLWEQNGVTLPLGLPDEVDPLLEHGHAFAGTPARFKDYVAEQIETVGANYFVCDLAYGDITLDEAMRTANLIASGVMPAFAEKGKSAAGKAA
jgi:alkanesulfonate monooxygenase SsuD/methylene tetrahydromethanopterin reductase-like flavin-dependent oxidoreductase (luciferase family)